MPVMLGRGRPRLPFQEIQRGENIQYLLQSYCVELLSFIYDKKIFTLSFMIKKVFTLSFRYDEKSFQKVNKLRGFRN